MRVMDVMTSNPACCTPNASLAEVAQLMIDNDCGEIPIVENQENRELLGVVTDRDIAVRAVAQHRNADTKVAEIMTNDVIAVSESSDLKECCEKMEEHQIRRIPVLDDKGRLCGIVAQADIALNLRRSGTGEVVRDISKPATH